ncbi:MAG: hypothetical protein KIT45_07415 [Fimbriimonadia bacterium]|nr:hypothetical protein [Fimbriimonadia bacterium]
MLQNLPSLSDRRLTIAGSPEPLPSPVLDPLHRWSFPFRVQGFAAEFSSRGQPELRISVYTQKQAHFPLAVKACRLLLRCYELSLTRLQRDHPLRYDRLLQVFLSLEGKAGAEQQQNALYIYQVDPSLPPIEWARELSHEYGHWIVPPINSFREPEAWANGDLGERLFLKWLMETRTARRELTDEETCGATIQDLRAYHDRKTAPLIQRMTKEGLNQSRWRSRAKPGFEEYLALALYTESVYGHERLARAMNLAGGVEPDDFLKGLQESLTEQNRLTTRLEGTETYLFMPGGTQRWKLLEPTNLRVTPDLKRPDWIRVSGEAGAYVWQRK